MHVFVFSLLSDYTFILNLFISVVKRSYWNLTPSILVLCRFKAPSEIGILTHKNPSRKQIFFLSFLTSFSYFAAYFLYNYSSLKTSIDMIIFLLYLFLIISFFSGAWGSVVVKALRCYPGGPGIDSQWCHWGFFQWFPTEPCTMGSTQPLKMSTRDFSSGKGGRCVRLTTYHPCTTERQENPGS